MTRTALTLALLLSTTACERKAEPPPEPPSEEKPEVAEEPKKVEMEVEVVRQEGLGPGTEAQMQLLIQAKSAFLNDQWEEAEALFEKLIETEPVSGPVVTATIALGEIYNESEREDRAQQLYERLREKAPGIPEVHFVLARTLAEQGLTTKAIKAYERTVQLQPDYLQALVELAGLYTKAGRKEDAEKLFYDYEKKVYKLAKNLEAAETPPEEKVRILDIFSFVDDDRANQAIAKSVTDPAPEVREKAIYLAIELDIASVKKNLEVLGTSDPDRRVRLAAKEALKQLKDGETAGDKPTFVKD